MALDPRIIMGFNPAPIGPSLSQSLQDAQRQQAIEQGNQELAGQNALKQIFADPQSVDATGSPTPNALRRIMQADPRTGMQFQQNMLRTQQQQLQTQMLGTKLGQQKLDMTTDANAGALKVYDDAITNGIPEPQAREQAQQALTLGFDRIRQSGLFSDTESNGFQTSFDPARSRGYLASSLEWRTRQTQERAATRAEAGEAERERHDRAMEGKESPAAATERDVQIMAADAVAAKEKELGRPLTEAEKAQARQQARIDPKVQLQTAKDKARELPEDVAHNIAEQWVETGNMALLAGYSRSPTMKAQIETEILKVQKEHGLSPRDVARQSVQFAAYGQGVKAFEAGGKLEPIVRSQSVAVGHLALLDTAATALHNNNISLFNSIGNEWAKRTGRTAPTNFDGMKRIVAEELVKAVTGSAGALGDREALEKDLDKSNSPAQLHELMDRYKQMMAEQLSGLRQSYNRLDTGKDFDKQFLSPDAQREIARYGWGGQSGGGQSGGGGGAQAAPSKAVSKAEYDALPKGAQYRHPNDSPGAPLRIKQ